MYRQIETCMYACIHTYNCMYAIQFTDYYLPIKKSEFFKNGWYYDVSKWNHPDKGNYHVLSFVCGKYNTGTKQQQNSTTIIERQLEDMGMSRGRKKRWLNKVVAGRVEMMTAQCVIIKSINMYNKHC